MTANYAVTDRLAIYGQYARGFHAPPLKVLYVNNSSLSAGLEPQRSKNYQAGFVYHGSLIGAVSVSYAVYIQKRELKCACVGGSSNVPLGFVSLTENVMMIAMAIWMIVR